MHGRSLLIRGWLIAGCCLVSPVMAAELSFEERLKAERAIQRVYYGHQLQATRPFNEAVTTELLEREVRTQLKQSLLLETMWHTPVTAEALEAEMNRIALSTLLPQRLKEIYDALGWDGFLVQETFARAALVDRLARSFFASDRVIHASSFEEAESIWNALRKGELGIHSEHPRRTVHTFRRKELGERDWESLRSLPLDGTVEPPRERPESFVIRAVLEGDDETIEVATWSVPKQTWESWWRSIEPGLDDALAQAVASATDLPMPEGVDADDQTIAATCQPAGQWRSGTLDDIHQWRYEHIAVWTGQLMLIWGGYHPGGSIVDAPGERYDPLTDTWSPMSRVNEPPAGLATVGVWTGSEMIVWGSVYGGRYDPIADVWRTVPQAGCPPPRSDHTAVWTGARMIVWGGWWAASGNVNNGGIYDPATDTWSPMSVTGAPAARRKHTAVWTGNRMVVWGGDVTGGAYTTGGRYDPATDTWSSTATAGAPTGRIDHTAVWTGSRMIIWGGVLGAAGLAGRLYDPVNDTWTATADAPEARERHSAVWTGTEMVVWGGNTDGVDLGSRTGARYDPATNQWRSVTTQTAPDARFAHTAIWTGSLMIVWGGEREYGESGLGDGGRYDPAADLWTPVAGPSWRSLHTAVWTGTEMIVWGGNGGLPFQYLDSGGRYDPLLDRWTPTSLQGAPSRRASHTAVWTGEEMIVWGGYGGSYLDNGGRYDPLTDSWGPITMNGAPAARGLHQAVWTGSQMIVWGGNVVSGSRSGGRYDPAGDTWSPTSLTSAPTGRNGHSAVWTGTEMIVWGGSSQNSGGRYDPVLDTWRPTSLSGAPYARANHGAVWTGSEMLVYGGTVTDGTGTHGTNTGGRYHPGTDTWRPTSQTGTPVPGAYSDSIVSAWTGTRMVVWGYNGHSGAYHPASNTWSALPAGAPDSSMDGYKAVWDGEGMIIWGFSFDWVQPVGGRYVPGPDLSADADGDGATICAGDCADSDPSVGPGGAQLCDNKNNDCSHPSWPSLAGTNEVDGDGDGLSACAGDCHDADPSVWATPSEAVNLQLASGDIITWDAPSQPGGSPLRYDTLRSATATDFVTAASCVESDDGTDRSALDPAIPLPGSVHYYLVRAENDCPGALGTGPLGASSNGSPRAGRACP